MADIPGAIVAEGKVLESTGDITRAEQVAFSGDIATRIVTALEEINTSLPRLFFLVSAATEDGADEESSTD